MLDRISKDLPFVDHNIEAPLPEAANESLDLESLQWFSPVEPVPAGGFLHKWGLQAWADLFIGRWALKQLAPLVPHTLVPIIKLCAPSRRDVTSAYEIILAQKEVARRSDSPREKWRMAYGNFVRELEWACTELKKYFNKAAYEDLVINATADYIRGALGAVVASMNRMMVMGHKNLKNNQSRLLKKIIHISTAFFFEKVVNLTGWLVGEVKITEVDMGAGIMVMEVVDCLMLRAPRLKSLPEESCLLGCKGGCEKVYEEGAVRMMLETRLPETTCEIRIEISE